MKRISHLHGTTHGTRRRCRCHVRVPGAVTHLRRRYLAPGMVCRTMWSLKSIRRNAFLASQLALQPSLRRLLMQRMEQLGVLLLLLGAAGSSFWKESKRMWCRPRRPFRLPRWTLWRSAVGCGQRRPRTPEQRALRARSSTRQRAEARAPVVPPSSQVAAPRFRHFQQAIQR